MQSQLITKRRQRQQMRNLVRYDERRQLVEQGNKESINCKGVKVRRRSIMGQRYVTEGDEATVDVCGPLCEVRKNAPAYAYARFFNSTAYARSSRTSDWSWGVRGVS
jgi:hypothetical protein